MLRAEIFCGAAIPNSGGKQVQERDFEAFLNDVVTPRFPGFTVHLGRGWWKGVFEPTRVITIYAPSGNVTKDAIEFIAKTYAERFGQESVLFSINTSEILFAGPRGLLHYHEVASSLCSSWNKQAQEAYERRQLLNTPWSTNRNQARLD